MNNANHHILPDLTSYLLENRELDLDICYISSDNKNVSDEIYLKNLFYTDRIYEFVRYVKYLLMQLYTNKEISDAPKLRWNQILSCNSVCDFFFTDIDFIRRYFYDLETELDEERVKWIFDNCRRLNDFIKF